MSNHLGDTNKMVDTPRTDAVWQLFATDTTLEPDVEFSTLARQLERELNAANVEIERLTKKVAQLYEGAEEQKDRIKRLEADYQNALDCGGLAFGYAAKGDFESANEVWLRAKEAK